MLILTRRVGEILRIEDEIKLVVIDIDTFHVKLGVEAPKNISVHREEIYRRIRHGHPISFAVR